MLLFYKRTMANPLLPPEKRWAGRKGGVSFTQVIKQGGGQRLQSLEMHRDQLLVRALAAQPPYSRLGLC
jgi:hypothetical protein